MRFLIICAAVDKISSEIGHRAVSLGQLSFLSGKWWKYKSGIDRPVVNGEYVRTTIESCHCIGFCQWAARGILWRVCKWDTADTKLHLTEWVSHTGAAVCTCYCHSKRNERVTHASSSHNIYTVTRQLTARKVSRSYSTFIAAPNDSDDGRCLSLTEEMRFKFIFENVQWQTIVAHDWRQTGPYYRSIENKTLLSAWRLYLEVAGCVQ